MNQRPTFAELLQASREGRSLPREPRPVVKVKAKPLPADPEERSRVIREAARCVIERHRDELQRLAYR